MRHCSIGARSVDMIGCISTFNGMRSPSHSLLCAWLCLAVSAASAGGLYWSDRSGSNNRLRGCNFDGSNVRDVRPLVSSDPRGIVVDVAGGRIYFLTRSPGVLQSIDLAN